jgi:hypothetical protein
VATALRIGLGLGVLAGVLGCGRLERDCRAVTTRANTFIAEGEKLRPKPDASAEDTAREALETAKRYDRLAADLAAIEIGSSKLEAEVVRYRGLAERSAASLRAVAKALGDGDFDTARKKRVELDAAAKSEGPLVARINEICGQK